MSLKWKSLNHVFGKGHVVLLCVCVVTGVLVQAHPESGTSAICIPNAVRGPYPEPKLAGGFAVLTTPVNADWAQTWPVSTG